VWDGAKILLAVGLTIPPALAGCVVTTPPHLGGSGPGDAFWLVLVFLVVLASSAVAFAGSFTRAALAARRGQGPGIAMRCFVLGLSLVGTRAAKPSRPAGKPRRARYLPVRMLSLRDMDGARNDRTPTDTGVRHLHSLQGHTG
jgi:hypothetical protein